MTDVIFTVRVGFDWWFPNDLTVKVTLDANGVKHYYIKGSSQGDDQYREYPYNDIKFMITDLFRPENVQMLDNANPTYDAPPPPPPPPPPDNGGGNGGGNGDGGGSTPEPNMNFLIVIVLAVALIFGALIFRPKGKKKK